MPKKGEHKVPEALLAQQQAVRMRAAKRRPLVWDMAQKGLSLRIIQEELKKDGFYVSLTTLSKDVRRWADELNKANLSTAVRQRRMQLDRITTVVRGLWSKIVKGDLPSIREFIRLMDHEAKLLGLYAPAKVDIEHRIREAAVAQGDDPDVAVRTAAGIVKELNFE